MFSSEFFIISMNFHPSMNLIDKYWTLSVKKL